MNPIDVFQIGSKWTNDNQGVVTLGIFLVTIIFGWASGIFSALRRRPKLIIRAIEGPTLCCTYVLGGEHGGLPVHRTAVSLYLNIANVGTASTSVDSVWIGYHWSLVPFSWKWLR